jgi:hypothetical protein
MAFNSNAGRNGPIAPVPPQAAPGARPAPPAAPAAWNVAPLRPPSSPQPVLSLPSLSPRRRRHLIALVSFALLIVLLFAALRFSMVATATSDLLQVRIGSQQPALIDLHQSLPISPDILGTNVFPLAGTNSIAEVSSGFMNFTPSVRLGLQDMHIGMLRYPGGNWGEEHILSYNQLADFAQMLNATGSEGMLQVHISGPIHGQPQGLNTVQDGANMAGNWVNFMNAKNGYMRQGALTNLAFHPVNLWTVGNEPDLLINPATKQKYTVDQYVSTFIQYSTTMHQNDQAIKVFGPEISDFNGIGAGPFDANNKAWMEGFLQGVGAYQKAHPELHYHLLDGVSFHSYQFNDARNIPNMLLSSPEEWNYLLPPLREEIQRDLGYSVPIAITEINTNPENLVPTRGQAALWWADTLGTLMNQQVGYVGFFSAADVPTPYPLFAEPGQQETPMARVMQLFAHLQHNLVPLDIQDDPVSVYVTQDNTHQTVSLLFVNKSNSAQLAQIDPQGQFLISAWHHLDIALAADSIVEVTLHRGASSSNYASAYSYEVPAVTDPTTQPLLYTVCGQKKDQLASVVPC